MAINKNSASGVDRFDEYSELSIQQTDEVRRLPGVYGTPLHVEAELDAFGREQAPLWEAEGLAESRDSFVEYRSLRSPHRSLRRVVASDMQLVRGAQQRLLGTSETLAPFVRRRPEQKLWYYSRTGLLLLGDVAGQAGAQIYYGEVPELALIQSLAAGASVVTAGLLGAEIKQLRSAAGEALGADRSPGRPLLMCAGAVGTLISLGIFGLRTAVEDPLAGMVYGALAAGVAIASFISSYAYADPAADAIDAAERAYAKAVKRQLALAGHPGRRSADAAAAMVASIREEHVARGVAAEVAHEGLKHRVLRRNPGIAGHSPAGQPEPVVGSRARRTGGK